MVTVKLDKERHLKLTLRGMLAFEDKVGVNLFRGFDLKEMTLRQKAILLWACLIDEDRELTFEAFIDMVDRSNLNALTDAVGECIIQSIPDAKESADPLAVKEKSPPG